MKEFDVLCRELEEMDGATYTALLAEKAARVLPALAAVSDSGVDMQTGRNAGMETAGVLWGFRGETELKENGAAHLVRSAGELLQLALS